MELLLAVLGDVVQPMTLVMILLGVFIGQIAGAVPGISAPTAIAIAVPITFYMSPVTAIAFLISMNKGGTVGGSASAILLNTPGTPDAAATALDGYPLAKRGKPLKALRTALYSSIFGDSFSDIVLILAAAPLAIIALQMGPPEIFSVVVFSLTIIGVLVGNSALKGLIAALFGIFLSTIGLDPEAGTARLTLGVPQLLGGVPLIALGIGVLALSEVLLQMETPSKAQAAPISTRKDSPRSDRHVTWSEFRSLLPTLLRSTGIGTIVGITPGVGSTVASFLGYAAAKKASQTPEKFGTGHPPGIAATEAANSSVVGANMIPLLALGIPGNVTAALLVGAFVIHGITPGPLLFEEQPRLVYGLFCAMVIANIFNLIVGLLGLRVYAQIVKVPATIIYPIVVLLCLTGAYISDGGMFGMGIAIIFTVAGYLMRRFDYSFITFVIGFVLGPMFELSLRQTLVIFGGNLSEFSSRPVAMLLLMASVVIALAISYRRARRRKNKTTPVSIG